MDHVEILASLRKDIESILYAYENTCLDSRTLGAKTRYEMENAIKYRDVYLKYARIVFGVALKMTDHILSEKSRV